MASYGIRIRDHGSVQFTRPRSWFRIIPRIQIPVLYLVFAFPSKVVVCCLKILYIYSCCSRIVFTVELYYRSICFSWRTTKRFNSLAWPRNNWSCWYISHLVFHPSYRFPSVISFSIRHLVFHPSSRFPPPSPLSILLLISHDHLYR